MPERQCVHENARRVRAIYSDEDFAELYAVVGQPAETPWRLALVTVMQFAEDLTDRQAAEAVRTRIDWKYALGLSLTDPRFHFSVLSDFRNRLIQGNAEAVLLDKMLSVFKEHGWLKAGQRQRTDATHVVAATRTLSRIEMVGETLRQALNVLATVLPDWLEEQVSLEWYDRYGRAFESYRMPKTEAELLALAEQIGRDGWEQQYVCEDDTVRWRSKEALPESADLICTPYDPQARYSRKRETKWIGYKVHLTETCEADAPHLITHVETTPATQPDSTVVDTIHTDLEQRQILPGEHIADTAYVSSANLVNSQTQHVDLVGPVNLDNSWQAQADQGFDASHF